MQKGGESDSGKLLSENSRRSKRGKKSSTSSLGSEEKEGQDAVDVQFGSIETHDAATIVYQPDGSAYAIPNKTRHCMMLLLQINSPAITNFLKDKELYKKAATDAKCMMELSGSFAVLIENESIKYRVVQIIGTSIEEMEEFMKTLEELNPAFESRIMFDFDKYRVVRPPRPAKSPEAAAGSIQSDNSSSGGSDIAAISPRKRHSA